MKKIRFAVVLAGAVAVVGWNVFGLGMDHPNDQPVNNPGSWPEGMQNLVNRTNRVYGFSVNTADDFFFSGTTTNFSSFLEDYSRIGGTVDRHRLILHDGVGEAKSPWSGRGPCDWELYGQGNGWKNGICTNYILEVHFWTGGKIALDRVAIPKTVEVTKAK